jgi:hypothetical protein
MFERETDPVHSTGEQCFEQ